jgi:malonate decarboxylase delta subunit
MQTYRYRFPADTLPRRRAHRGVVASGDLEVLLDPAADGVPAGEAHVVVRTSVDGFDAVWQHVLERFFARTPLQGRWLLNDAGATPGVVALRLRQTADDALADEEAPR